MPVRSFAIRRARRRQTLMPLYARCFSFFCAFFAFRYSRHQLAFALRRALLRLFCSCRLRAEPRFADFFRRYANGSRRAQYHFQIFISFSFHLLIFLDFDASNSEVIALYYIDVELPVQSFVLIFAAIVAVFFIGWQVFRRFI
jgi:hypothetical protein